MVGEGSGEDEISTSVSGILSHAPAFPQEAGCCPAVRLDVLGEMIKFPVWGYLQSPQHIPEKESGPFPHSWGFLPAAYIVWLGRMGKVGKNTGMFGENICFPVFSQLGILEKPRFTRIQPVRRFP